LQIWGLVSLVLQPRKPPGSQPLTAPASSRYNPERPCLVVNRVHYTSVQNTKTLTTTLIRLDFFFTHFSDGYVQTGFAIQIYARGASRC